MLEIKNDDPRIERYFPDVLVPALEFQELAKVINPEIKAIADAMVRLFLFAYVNETDNRGLSRWEDMLKLSILSTDTTEQRRTRILAKLNTLRPYTHRQLEYLMNIMYGDGNTTVSLDYANYSLRLFIATSLNDRINEIVNFVSSIMPANLTASFSMIIELKGTIYTGGRMATCTKYYNLVKTTNNHEINGDTYFGGGVTLQKEIQGGM